MTIARFLGAAIASAALMVMPARAATYLVESFSFSGSGYSVTGKFVYDQSNGRLQSISGSVASSGGTQAITALVPADYDIGQNIFHPDPNDDARYMSYDNLFVAGVLSQDGILFSFGTGNFGGLYILPKGYDFPAGPYFTTWLPDGPTTPLNDENKVTCPGNLYCPGIPGTLDLKAVGAVPELSTWAMLLIGFLGVGIVSRGGASWPAVRRRLVAGVR